MHALVPSTSRSVEAISQLVAVRLTGEERQGLVEFAAAPGLSLGEEDAVRAVSAGRGVEPRACLDGLAASRIRPAPVPAAPAIRVDDLDG